MEILKFFIISLTIYFHISQCNATVAWSVDVNDYTAPKSAALIHTEEFVEKRIGIIRQRRECIYAHTVVRQLHGLYAVHWSEELAYDAELWAIHLASNVGQLQHSSLKFSNGTPYGENLYEMSGQVKAARCHMAVHAWYSEVHNYNFDNPQETSQNGHFTQLVWTSTDHFGLGVAYSKDTKKTFIVARYTPPGNWNLKYIDISQYVWRMKPGTSIPTEKELLPQWAREPIVADIGVTDDADANTHKDCVDLVDCKYYVKQGDCNIAIYKPFMQQSCYKSCSTCKPGPPVNGDWTNWHQVSTCSLSCGGGMTLWYRFCTKPVPSSGGKYCVGKDMKSESCNTQKCPSTTEVGVERNTSCEAYKERGYCIAGIYMEWMHQNCKNTCSDYLKHYWMVS